MVEYKFRAECKADVDELSIVLEKCGICHKMTITPDKQFPDVEVLIKLSNVSLDELRKQMHKVEDGHVMVQTLAPDECYTGERDYEA